MPRRLSTAAVAAVLSAALGLVALLTVPAASAARGFETGLSDHLFTTDARGSWLDRAASARSGVIRVFVSWRVIADAKPEDAGDPADPAYDFSSLDATVEGIADRGMEPLLTLYEAPSFAEGSGAPRKVFPGTWKPSPVAFGGFARAVARRYSGSFSGLPRVRYFQAWNEPNITTYLAPQWDGKKLVAADHYEEMMNAAATAIRSVHRSNRLVAAGLAPYGDPPGGDRSRPLTFWREVLCLKDRDKLKKARGCGAKPDFDVFAAHAINTSGPPQTSALNPDDASTGDLPQIARTLRKAEQHGTVAGRRHPMWITEFWWESDPPDRKQGYPVAKHARFLAETLYLAWRAGFSVGINLQIRDERVDDSNMLERNATGLYFSNGTAKPALRAYTFPFVADRAKGSRIRLWGKAPRRGQAVIERKAAGGWRPLKRVSAGASQIFTARARLEGPVKLRARSGGETSLVWKLK